jgi:hypothetical protein
MISEPARKLADANDVTTTKVPSLLHFAAD